MNQKVKWLFYKLAKHNFLYFFILANAVYFKVFKKGTVGSLAKQLSEYNKWLCFFKNEQRRMKVW